MNDNFKKISDDMKEIRKEIVEGKNKIIEKLEGITKTFDNNSEEVKVEIGIQDELVREKIYENVEINQQSIKVSDEKEI